KGKPAFVTNWDGFLEETATNAANVAISSLNDVTHGQLCSSFGPLITLQLRQRYLTEIPTTCTLDQVIRNVEGFYQSFENGGWIAYGALTSPGGNYYSGLLEAQIAVENKINSAKQNQIANVQSNNGFLGQKVCVEPSKKSVHHDAQTSPDTVITV